MDGRKRLEDNFEKDFRELDEGLREYLRLAISLNKGINPFTRVEVDRNNPRHFVADSGNTYYNFSYSEGSLRVTALQDLGVEVDYRTRAANDFDAPEVSPVLMEILERPIKPESEWGYSCRGEESISIGDLSQYLVRTKIGRSNIADVKKDLGVAIVSPRPRRAVQHTLFAETPDVVYEF
ncbi:MAG: hypothetical protein ACOCXG_01155 [Nanoarchaeota archaeon]